MHMVEKRSKIRQHVCAKYCCAGLLVIAAAGWIFHATFSWIPWSMISKSALDTESKNRVLFPDVASKVMLENVFKDQDFLLQKIAYLISLADNSAHTMNYTKHDINKLKYYHMATSEINFSYVLDELIVSMNVQKFFRSLSGCEERAQMKELIKETDNTLLYHATHENKDVIVEVAKADLDGLIAARCGSSDSVHSQENLDRCFLLKYNKILQKSLLLIALSHDNVVEALGVCISRPHKQIELNRGAITSSGVTLMQEYGNPFKFEKYRMSSWENRIKACYYFANLAVFLSESPIGSVELHSWDPTNFQVSSTGIIKLQALDQAVYVTEPACERNDDCLVEAINANIKCNNGKCVGYNAKKNIMKMSNSILFKLLQYQDAPVGHSDAVSDVIVGLSSLKFSPKDLLLALEKLLPHKQLNKAESRKEDGNADNFQQMPDGLLVDSWDKHEARVSINDIDGQGLHLINEINHGEVNSELDGDLDAYLGFQHEPKSLIDGFQKIENADYPGRYDYYCPKSKAEWGCIMSLQTVNEAIDFCLKDEKCKAIVTIPHLRKEGWIIAILKSDSSKPIDHSGTTVYIRKSQGSPQLDLQAPIVSNDQHVSLINCLNDVVQAQKTVRNKREQMIMNTLGWQGWSDLIWMNVMTESIVENATAFKPAKGKLANGGQMNIALNDKGMSHTALFLAKRGPEEYSFSQLAVYQLDRLLGLYKTLPVAERLLSKSELSNAGFPVDVGGNVFDKFRSLKQADESLLGVIVPQLELVTIEHFISVPHLEEVTNAVTPFSKKQWSDLEYLILGHLTGLPFPHKGHASVQGSFFFFKTDTAFVHKTEEYLPYFYNCQFPSHVIAVLRASRALSCELAAEFKTKGADGMPSQVSDFLQQNVASFLQVVDSCIVKFGKQLVIYEA